MLSGRSARTADSHQGDDMEGYQYQEVECSECGELFKRFRHIEVTYTTEVME